MYRLRPRCLYRQFYRATLDVFLSLDFHRNHWKMCTAMLMVAYIHPNTNSHTLRSFPNFAVLPLSYFMTNDQILRSDCFLPESTEEDRRRIFIISQVNHLFVQFAPIRKFTAVFLMKRQTIATPSSMPSMPVSAWWERSRRGVTVNRPWRALWCFLRKLWTATWWNIHTSSQKDRLVILKSRSHLNI